MKFNFKKISAIATSVLLTGMTLGVAAAANFPAPFGDGSSSDVAIVTGTGLGVDDGAASTSISNYLANEVSGSTGAPIGGDFIQLERSTDKFNLQDNMSSFYSIIDESELSTLLAKGVYTNDAHNDYDYTQDIALGVDLQLTHFLNSDFNGDKPTFGFDMNSDDLIMNYTLKFTPTDAQGVDSDWSGITNSNFPFLGKDYYVLDMTNTSATGGKITLLNAAASGELTELEQQTYQVDGKSYTVIANYIDSNSVVLSINGESTDSLAAAETQKLSDGTYVGIKEVDSQGISGGQSYVKFSLGTGKLVLENDKEVELNSEKISKTKYAVEGSDEELQHTLKSYITTTSGYNLDSVVLEWAIKDDTWIASGTELTMPGFESVKFSMGDFIVDKEEVTTLKGDSNTFTLKAMVTDGELDLDMLYLNDSSTGIAGLGKDSTHQLVTSSDSGGTTLATGTTIKLNESLNNYFVVTWINSKDFETFAYTFSVEDNDADANVTTLTSMTGGNDITIDGAGQYNTEGHIKFQVDVAEEDHAGSGKEYLVLNISATSGDVFTDRIVTAEGLEISLPVINSTGVVTAADKSQVNINATAADPTAWTQMFDEEDKDETINEGSQFNATYAISGTDGLEVSTLVPATLDDKETEDNSDYWVGYMPSDLATKVVLNKPTSGLNELAVTYHGSEAYAEVFLTEASSSSGTTGSMVFTDAEKSDWQDLHVILVGGSCINSATAKALFNDESPVCEDAFTTAASVGEGEYMIKSMVSPFNSAKTALIVAGYARADTAAAASKLVDSPAEVDTTVGNEYRGMTGVEGSLVFAQV